MTPRPVPEIDPILCAAAELFEKRGYDDVSVEMVADRAGVGRSTAFARYLSKQGILIGIVQAFLYQFPMFLAQIDLSVVATDKASPPVVTPRRGRRFQTPPAMLPASRVEPGPARLLAALHEFCKQWGSIARIALTAKDLPWVRRALGNQIVLFQNAARLYLGPAAGDRLVSGLAADLLKHACCGNGNGNGGGSGIGDLEAIDERAVVEMLSLVSSRTSVSDGHGRHSPPPPLGSGTDPQRLTPAGARR